MIEAQIQEWANQHSLKLATSPGARVAKYVYLSSETGECFQIWVEAPAADRVSVYATCIEGRKEDDSPREWVTNLAGTRAALERALETVESWMIPSKRYFPAGAKP